MAQESRLFQLTCKRSACVSCVGGVQLGGSERERKKRAVLRSASISVNSPRSSKATSLRHAPHRCLQIKSHDDEADLGAACFHAGCPCNSGLVQCLGRPACISAGKLASSPLRRNSAHAPHTIQLKDKQYQIKFSDGSISDEHAKSLYLSSQTADSQKGAVTSNVDISQQPQHDSGIPVGATDPFHRDQDHDDELSATYERLVLHSRPYLCRIPVLDTTGNRTASNATQSAADEEKELIRATDRGWELLKGMQGNCIYFLSGWWSYSFCYNDGVKQFHQLPPGRGIPIYPPVEDESVTSYILGRFPEDDKKKGKKDIEAEEANMDDEGNSKGPKKDEDTAVARMETKGESRYLVQKLTGGTTCDLTGKERKIEVQVSFVLP